MPHPFEKRLQELENKIDRLERGNHTSGTVVNYSTADKTVDMLIVDPDGTSKALTFPVATNFIPEIGSKAVVTLNGTNPLVVPLNGQTVAADGSWLRSPDYVAGVSGWKIDADGTAEFNNVIVRGTLAAAIMDTAVLAAVTHGGGSNGSAGAIPNGTFDVDISGWTAGANTTIARVTTPVQAGAGAMRLTATGAGSVSANTPTGTSGIPCTPGQQIDMFASFRAGTTARSCFLQFKFYNAAGALIPLWNGGTQGKLVGVSDSSAAYTTQEAWATPPPTAATYAIFVTVTGCINGEIHYVDSIAYNVVSTTGWCADVDPDGAYVNEEGSNEGAQSPLWGAPGVAEIYGFSRAAGGSGISMIAGFHAVSPRQAYTVLANTLAVDSAAGVTVRAFMAFYDSTGALLDTTIGTRPYKANNANPPLANVKESFLAPADAAYAFYGFKTDPSFLHSGRGRVIDINEVRLYETSVIESAVMVPEAQASNSRFPTGIITPYAGSTGLAEPFEGWVPKEGQAVSRSRYADLFALIGTQYGAGDGSTTFNVPADWNSYTPTWTASASAVSIGNGALVGRYKVLGPHTVALQIALSFGSTTNGGTGFYTFTLPFQGSVVEQILRAKAFVATNVNFQGYGIIGVNASALTLYMPNSQSDGRLSPAQNSINPATAGTGVPAIAGNFTWGNGNNITIDGVYETGSTIYPADLIKT